MHALPDNGFVEWIHNGGQCGRHSSMLNAPLRPIHGRRWASHHGGVYAQ
jgi:hypothetical protein